MLSGCKPLVVVPLERISLSWESSGNRQAWSNALTGAIKTHLNDLSKAKDVTGFCPKFNALPEQDKIKALGEIFVGMALYESSWKPETVYRECSKKSCVYGSGCVVDKTYGYCMKGSSKYDNGLVISRGLLQMSISSSLSYGCDLKSSDDLHVPSKNLECATLIMQKLVAKRGTMTTASNYWSVMKSGYSRNHIAEIKARVKKYAPLCN